MNASLIFLLAAAWGALLELEDVPWRNDESAVMIADFDSDGRGEVGVLSPGRLDVYDRNRSAPSFVIDLPTGTSIVDVIDGQPDGPAWLVAIAGESIFQIPITDSAEAPAPVLCFSRENQYSHYAGSPFPGVLVIMRDETPLIALPCTDALEMRSLDGKIVDSYPIGIAAPRRLALGQPFSVWTNQHAQSGSNGALEFRISSVATYKPMLPDDAFPIAIAEPSGRLGTPRQQRDAVDLDPDRWPWFPVSMSDTGQIRALYARTEASDGQTQIRIRQIGQDAAADNAERTGPVRSYPGLILRHPNSLPDFNGDGFHDLLLWNPQRVVTAVDSLTRAAALGTWPVRIIAHAYGPEKRRFVPKPLGQIALDIPLNWYLAAGSGSPFHVVLLHDINGDGRTDFGALVDTRTAAFWLSREDGFSAAPDFKHAFSESIIDVVFETDLEGKGRTTIALRSKSALHILRPDTTFSP